MALFSNFAIHFPPFYVSRRSDQFAAMHMGDTEPRSNDFNAHCAELLARGRFHDVRSFAIMVIDSLFNGHIELTKIHNSSVDFSVFDQLIGFHSEVFKKICSDDALFSYLIQSFVNHSKRSRTPLAILKNSLFVNLVNVCLNHLLPLDDDMLAMLKKNDWFSNVDRKAVGSSAFRLLRPQVIASCYAPELVYDANGLQSLYPRLFQFAKDTVAGLADRGIVPCEPQVIFLEMLSIHYLNFLLAPTRDMDFAAFKQNLRNSSVLVSPVKLFLQRWLNSMSIDDVYGELIEFWVVMILPSESNPISRNRESLKSFYKISSCEFIELLPIIESRCLMADLKQPDHAKFVVDVMEGVFDDTLCKMYEKLRVDPANFFMEMRGKAEQFKQVLTTEKEEAQKKNSGSILAGFFGYMQDIVNASPVLGHIDHMLEFLDKKLAGRPHANMTVDSSFGDVSLDSSFRPLANSTPKRKSPDCKLDPITKLYYLSPTGRKQVLQRQACFDFSKCAENMSRNYPAAGPYENEFLLKLSFYFSSKFSDSAFTRYLRVNNGRTLLATALAKVFLVKNRHPRYVPVYSRHIVERAPTLNLRFMASYPFLILASLFLWLMTAFFVGMLF